MAMSHGKFPDTFTESCLVRSTDGSLAALDTPRVNTPFDVVASSLDDARNLSYRVAAIVDTLIGSRPEDPSKGPNTTVGGGLLPNLRANAEDAAAIIRRTQDELTRLCDVLNLPH